MNRSGLRAHGWSLASQSLSSGRSIGFAIVAAGLVDADDFGLIAIVVSASIAANGLLRAAASHPLALIDAGGADADTDGDLLTAAVRHQVALATVMAVVVAAVAVLTGAPATLISGALLFPLVALHDGVRVSALNLGRGVMATVADALWFVSLAVVLLAAALTDLDRPFPLVIGWALTAGSTAFLVLGVHHWTGQRRIVAAGSFATTHGRLGRRLAGQLLLETVPVRVLPLAVAAIAAVRDAGALRGAESLLGGATIIWSAISLSVLRQARARARDTDDRGVLRFVAATMFLPLVAVAANAALVLLLPDDLGEGLLGDTWEGAVAIMPSAAALLMAQVVLGTVATAQRATHRDDDVRDMLAIIAVLTVVVVPASAVVAGVNVAIVVDAACLLIGAAIGARWLIARRGSGQRRDDDHEERPARTG